ncbi:MAG: hypothetical protein EAY75_16565 [Bacteroidetes bacterium]|nr:MAG: hypothetical protein EAY75_16565 [Bacteroidota bacterium]
MRKLYTVLTALTFGFLLLASVAEAQTFTRLWRKLANGTDYTWFTGAVGSSQVNNTTSLDYNPATDKLLVACRNNSINIINPSTGTAEGTMNLTGLGAEAFKFNKIRVDADGVIYGISLATGAGTCKIYRWASQAAAPVECASFAVTERTGDAFALSGRGSNTILYASGSGTTSNAINIYVLTTANGTNFTTESKISVASNNVQWANRAIDPVTNSVTSDLWIKHFTSTDGTGSGLVSFGFGGMRLLTNAIGRKFLTFSGGNNSFAGTKMKMINVDNEAALVDFGQDSSSTAVEYQTNGNGTGDVAFKNNTNGSYTVFFLSTNNGIAATQSTNDLLPVVLTRFSAALRGKLVLLEWNTNTEDLNRGFAVERSMNGTDFSSIGFVGTKAPGGNSAAAIGYQFEDPKPLPGTSFYRLRQLNTDGKASVSKVEAIQNTAALPPLWAGLGGSIARGQLSLIVKAAAPKTVAVSVINAGGQIMETRVVALAQGNTNLSLSTQGYAKGVLLISVVNVANANERITLKAIKE